MKAGNGLARLVPAALAAAIAIGLGQVLAASLRLHDGLQIIAFSLIGICWVGYFDLRKSREMRGCMTVLSFCFVPMLAVTILALSWLSVRPELDPLLAWSGLFRLPAILFLTGALVSAATVGQKGLRRKKRKRFIDLFEFALAAAGLGIFASLIGFVWLGIGFGLDRLGM